MREPRSTLRRDCGFCLRPSTSLYSDTFAPDQGALVNKNELIDAVAAATGLTKADAEKALEAVFGTFGDTKRAASEGRNPRTGEKIQIPASKLPKFRAGKGLKEAVQ